MGNFVDKKGSGLEVPGLGCQASGRQSSVDFVAVRRNAQAVCA